jgi:hypothetical protein
MARPIPRVPPVTTTVLCLNSMASSLHEDRKKI